MYACTTCPPGPLWAPLGPCGPPLALVGQAIVGRPSLALVGAPWALVSLPRALVGALGPLWAPLGPWVPTRAEPGATQGFRTVRATAPWRKEATHRYIYILIRMNHERNASRFSGEPETLNATHEKDERLHRTQTEDCT